MLGILFTIVLCQPLSASIVSTYDSDLDGWILPNPTDASFSWESPGGNPGGFARFIDGLQNNGGLIRAPGKFLGDWSSFDSISFEHRQIAAGIGNSYVPYEVFLSGAGGSARFTESHPGTAGSWISVTAPLTEPSWTIESGTWAGLISNVTQFEIRIEVLDNNNTLGDTAGIDNVVLRSAAVPEPASLAIWCGIGMAGMIAGWRTRASRCLRGASRKVAQSPVLI
ncbi:MAG: hypothetical protein IAF94_18200 [Pirellulaceae bacterium]|nr:hypothetical protein [Pirellulaceae bacterium]